MIFSLVHFFKFRFFQISWLKEKDLGNYSRRPNRSWIGILIGFMAFMLFSNSMLGQATIPAGLTGTPITNVDFGQGTTRGSLNPSDGSTGYTFQPSPNPVTAGYYAITNNPNSANAAFLNGGDHTGNTNGQMMVISGGSSPSNLFGANVYGLCTGYNYLFSAWIANVDPTGTPIPVNITFEIHDASNGTLLASANTGNINATGTTSVPWNQYGLVFTMPAGVTSLELILKNNGAAGSGNDLALDDIQFASFGPQVTQNNTTTINTCPGTSVALTADVKDAFNTAKNGYASPVFQWQVSTDNGVTFNNDPLAPTSPAASKKFSYTVTAQDNLVYRLLISNSGDITNANCRVNSAYYTFQHSTVFQIDSSQILCYNTKSKLLNSTNPTGSIGPYTYQWLVSTTSPSSGFTPISGATSASYQPPGLFTQNTYYQLAITAGNGCTTNSNVITIRVPSALSSNGAIGSTQPSCFGGSDGSITIPTGTGGIKPYTYSIGGTNYQASNVFTGISSGNYNLFIKDSIGCIYNPAFNYYVSQPNQLSSNPFSYSLPTCYGKKDGSVNVNAFNGTPPYVYSLDGVTYQSNANFTGLAGGAYTFYVKDSKGCIISPSFTLPSPAPSLSFTSQVNPTGCSGPNSGSIQINAVGGVSPLQYSIDGGITFQTSNIFNGLNAGTYPSLVKDANGCTSITQNLTITTGSLIIMTALKTDVLCKGGSTGTITVIVLGGKAPYQYSLDTGTTYQSSNIFNHLEADDYLVQVKDANGCILTKVVVIKEPNSSLSFTVSSQTNVPCTGGNVGSFTLSASGGTPPYQYSNNGGTSFQASSTFSNLASGNYNILVIDANGCAKSSVLTISQGSGISFSTSGKLIASCNTKSLGNILVSASGGNGSYQYSDDGGITYQISNQFSGLTAGNYFIVVKDGTGCVTSAQKITITNPPLNLYNVSGGGGFCKGGSTTISLSNSDKGVNYQLQNKGVNYGSIQAGTGIALNFAVVDSGTFTIVAQDTTSGCIATMNGTVSTQIYSLPQSFNVGGGGHYCTGGTGLSISLSGSETGVNYQLALVGPGPIYTPSGSIISGTGSNLIFSNITGAGTYTIQAVNSLTACKSYMNGTAIVIIDPLATISNAGPDQILSCSGSGTAQLAGNNPSIGTGLWTQITGPNTATILSPNAYNTVLNNLIQGSYTFQWTISNGGCGDNNSQVHITVPPPINFSLIPNNITCFGASNGTIQINASGGNGVYSYSINGGSTYQSSNSFTGLAPGSYTIMVKDGTGCSSGTSNIILSQPSSGLSLSIQSQTNVSCNGGSDGKFTISVTGGTGPYQYSINGGSSFQVSNQFSGLGAGTYTVLVSDNSSCNQSIPVTISQPSPLIVNITGQTNISCSGSTSGSATASGNGGTGPYTYSWNSVPVQNTPTANNLPAGTYKVTVTDAKGCQSSNTVIISQLKLNLLSQQNVNCFGASTGSATVAAQGGTTPYTYTWNTLPVQTGPIANNLAAGNYTVTVVDGAGCSNTLNITITQPSAPFTIALVSQTNPNCHGDATGTATIGAGGGVFPYSFSWNTIPVQNGPTATGLAAGTYILTGTDGNGCITQISVNIIDPPALLLSIQSQGDVTCSGGNNGSVKVQGSGGSPGYQYSIDGGNTYQATGQFNGLIAGTYSVQVKDSHNCTYAIPVTINEPTPFLVTVNAQSNVSCSGNPSGIITINASGGVSPYLYSDNGGISFQASNTFNGLAVGNYSVIVKDANSCTQSFSETITQPPALTVTISKTNITCFGSQNGTATANAIGGTPPYTYSWNTVPVQNTQTITGLGPGTYTVTVTDASGCSKTVSTTITQPASALTLNLISKKDVSCNGGNNGSFTVSASGGTGSGYVYSLNNINLAISGTAYASSLESLGYPASNAIDGDITTRWSSQFSDPQWIYVDLGSVQLISNVIIQWQNSNGRDFQIQTSNDAVTWTTVSSITGNAALTNSINIAASARYVRMYGTARNTSFGYSIYEFQVFAGQSSGTFNGLSAGNYTVWAIDPNGCAASNTITINQPNPLVSTITSSNNGTCSLPNSGSATVGVSGGTPPYTYSWNTIPVQTTATANNLSAGNYTVQIKDFNGCTTSTTVQITNLQLSLVSETDASCHGSATGSATVIASGGLAPYSYTWNTNPVQTGPIANNLKAGTYQVTVTDGNNCSVNLSVIIQEPASTLNAVIAKQTNISCYGNSNGSVIISASGGAGGYQYFVSGGTFSLSGDTIFGLSAGNYSVIVVDKNGCSSNVNNFTITQPASPLAFNISSQKDVSCFGGNNGSINLTASGGSGSGYVYSLNDINLALNKSVVSSTNQGPFIATNAVDGNLTTRWSSQFSDPQWIYVDLGSPQLLSEVILQWENSRGSNFQIQLSNDAITWNTVANIIGNTSLQDTIPISGTGRYVRMYGTSRYTSFGYSLYEFQVYGGQSSGNFSGLQAGNYFASLSDGNGCNAQLSFTIKQPNALVASISNANNISCFGAKDGTATVGGTGGTFPYTISWNTIPVQNGATISNLGPGNYTATITDFNGCTSSASISIIQPASALQANISSQTNIQCYGAQTGSIGFSASGGYGKYQYSIDGGNTFQSSPLFNNLNAGNYSIQVLDSGGCKVTLNTIITQPASALSLQITSQNNISCSGGATGSATVLASGGIGSYTYSWNTIPVQLGPTATGLSLGTYTVTVVDGNGCSISKNIIITQPSIQLISQTNITCNGASNGTATVSAQGGVAPYTYTWNTLPVQSGPTASGLKAGTYTVTAVDQNGCNLSLNIIITEPPPLISTAQLIQNVSCFGGNNGSAYVQVTGGTAPYTFSWNSNPVQTTDTALGLKAGNYIVMVKDAYGCTSQSNITIIQPSSPLSFTITSQTISTCNLKKLGSILVNASGGGGHYQYSDDGGTTFQFSSQFLGLTKGNYMIMVKDTNNCITSGQLVKIVNPPITLYSISGGGYICNGQSNPIQLSGSDIGFLYQLQNKGVNYGSPVYGTGSPLIFSVVDSGTYTILAQDTSSGCIATMNGSVTSKSQALPNIYQVTGGGAACISGPGVSIQLSGSEIGVNYQLVLMGPGPSYTPQGSALPGTGAGLTFSNITIPGNYTIQATNALSSCQNLMNGSVTISSLPAPSLSNAGPNQILSCSNSDSTKLSGNIPIVGTGTWSQLAGPNTALIQNKTLNNTGISGLISGTYVFQWSISNGSCSPNTSQVQIQVPNPITFTATLQAVSCFSGNNGTIIINAKGGTGAYTYSNNGGITYQASNIFSGLNPGNYNISVKDANGCLSNSSMVSINQPSSVLSGTITSQTNISCYGSSNGSVQVQANGGWGKYQFALDGSSSYQSSQNFTGLSAGAHFITIKDSLSCTTVLNFTLSQPSSAISFTASATNSSCNSYSLGSITISASGGTGPYQYSKDGGLTYQISNIFSGLSVGNYTIVVKDQNSCTSPNQVISVKPIPINNYAVLGSGIYCSSADVYLAKSDTGVVYQLQSGGVNIGSPVLGTGNQLFFPVTSSGTYSILATSLKTGCQVLMSTNANLMISSVPKGFNLTGGGEICAGGSGATLNLSGSETGVNYQLYSLSKGLNHGIYGEYFTNPILSGNPSVIQIDSNINFSDFTLSSSRPSGIPTTFFSVRWQGFLTAPVSGNYTFTTVNDDGIRVWINGKQIINDWNGHAATTNTSSPINLIGGQSYYVLVEYYQGPSAAEALLEWTYPGQTQQVIPFNSLNPAIPSTVGNPIPGTGNPLNFTNIQNSGYYIITATNAVTNCGPSPMIGIDTVKIDSLPSLSKAGPNQTLSCSTSNSVQLQGNIPSQGIGTWSELSGPNQANFVNSKLNNTLVTGLISGTYVFQWSIQSGTCGISNSTTQIIVPQPVIYSYSKTNIDCSSNLTGSIQILASGGIKPYQYSIDNGLNYSTNPNFTGLKAGNYTLIVQDSNHCISSKTLAQISSPIPINLIITNPATVKAPQTVDITNSSITQGSDPGLSFSYFKDSLGTQILTSPNQIGQSGTFYIKALNSSNCFIIKPVVVVITPSGPPIQTADLEIQKTADPIVQTYIYAYIISVQNHGPNTSTFIHVKDTLPKGMLLVSLTPDSGTTSFDPVSNSIQWNISKLDSGQTIFLTVLVKTETIGQIINKAWVKSSTKDPDSSNNLAINTLLKKDPDLFFPTLFTPNGDGINDQFIVRGLDAYPDNDIEIFNRWGNQVFKASGYQQNGIVWNGGNLNEGTYFYVCRVNIHGQNRQYSGYTTLVRGGGVK